MDAGKLRTFDPTAALRRPDAAPAQGGAPRFDAAALAAQALLELGAADEAAATGAAPTGPDGPPLRNGLLVNLSARALDPALAGRLPFELMGTADYSHLRRGAPQPARAEQPAAPQVALPLEPDAPRNAATRDTMDTAFPIRPLPQETGAPTATAMTTATATQPFDLSARAEASMPMAAAAAAAAQAALSPAPAKNDAVSLAPRPVPELMAPFFARPQERAPMRLSVGKLILAAAALAVVVLIVL